MCSAPASTPNTILDLTQMNQPTRQTYNSSNNLPTMIIPDTSISPRVSFSPKCSGRFVEHHNTFTASERDAYWYTADEIEAFHTEARTDCRTLRKAAGLPATIVGPCRGLELRRSGARQKRKMLTLHSVFRASKKVKGEKLARLARRCSEWAAKAARVEAQRDFLRAYADEKIVQMHMPALPPMAPFPLPLKGVRSSPDSPQQQEQQQQIRKRPSASCGSEPDNRNTERCVRQRTSCH